MIRPNWCNLMNASWKEFEVMSNQTVCSFCYCEFEIAVVKNNSLNKWWAIWIWLMLRTTNTEVDEGRSLPSLHTIFVAATTLALTLFERHCIVLHGKRLIAANLRNWRTLWVNMKTMDKVIGRLFLINCSLGTNSTVKSFKQLGVAKSTIYKVLQNLENWGATDKQLARAAVTESPTSLQPLTSVVLDEMLRRSETYPRRLVSSRLVLDKLFTSHFLTDAKPLLSMQYQWADSKLLLDSCSGRGGSASKFDDLSDDRPAGSWNTV